MKFKKQLSLLMALCLIMALFVGCGSTPAEETPTSVPEAPAANDNAPEAPPEEEPPEAPPEEEEPEEKGEYVAGTAVLPLADDGELSYFCEFPGYMSMFGASSYDDMDAFIYAEEITGIDIVFSLANMETYSTNFHMMLAGGEITDLVGGASGQYASTSTMIEDGAAIDLMPYVDLMPNYWNTLNYYDIYKPTAINLEGQMAEALTMADEYKTTGGLQIRKDWLDKLNMDIPETYDELHDVLLAFVNEFGADHAMQLQGTTQCVGSSLVGGYGTYGYEMDSTHNMFVIDGKVQNGILAPGYKDYLQMLAQWYSEGIIAVDFATESNDPFISNADAYIQKGNSGVWFAQSDNLDRNMAGGKDLDPEFNISAMPEPTLTADDVFHFGSTGVGTDGMGKNIAISECCEDIELACAWIDFWYTAEGQLLANYGQEGIAYTLDADGNPKFTDEVMHNDRFPMVSFALTYYTLACVPTLQDFDRVFEAYSPESLAAIELWSENIDSLYRLPDALELTGDAATEYAGLWSDISTYASTELFKFVMGEKNFEADWDNFLAQMDAMNIQRCIDLYQEAYDDYNEFYGLD